MKPNKNSIITLIFILSSFASIPGCVTFYRTSEIRKGFVKINDIVTSIENYKNEQQAGYYYLTSQVTATNDPFPEFHNSLQQFESVVDRMKKHRKEIDTVRNDFESLMAILPLGQNIQSDKPGWEEYKPMRKKIESVTEELNTCIEEVAGIQTSLNNAAKKYRMGKMNCADLKNQIISLMGETERYKTARQDKLSTESKEAIELKQREMKQLSDEINNELGEKTEIWVAPGSFVQVRFEQIKKKGEEVNEIISKAK